MRDGETPALRIVLWTIVLGVLFNALGWLGNNLWLGPAWDAAGAQMEAGFQPPWPAALSEVVTLLSDFIYAFAIVFVFSNAQRKTFGFALKLAFVIWVAGAALVYLVLVNLGVLPAALGLKTSLLALAIFLATAPLLPLVIKN